MFSDEGVNSEIEVYNCVKYTMISSEKVRGIKTKNMYKIKTIPLEQIIYTPEQVSVIIIR